MRIARVLAPVYAGLLIVFASFQTRIIFPGQDTQGQDYAQVRPRPGTELVRLKTVRACRSWPCSAPRSHPTAGPTRTPPTRPTLLYFYGNGMCLNDAMEQFEQFRRLGLNVLIPDYRGLRDERRSALRARLPGDGRGGLRLSGQDPRRPARRDRGGGLVARRSGRDRPGLACQVAGLIVFSAFTSGVDMAHRLVPFLPGSLLLRHRFDNIGRSPVACPILIGHGRHDRIVPFDMGERLAARGQGARDDALDRRCRPQ